MLYLLDRKSDCGYDEYIAKVIRANSHKEARIIANNNCGDECERFKNMWLNSKLVSCKIIKVNGKSKEILTDYLNG